jgi:hypothetical protein
MTRTPLLSSLLSLCILQLSRYVFVGLLVILFPSPTPLFMSFNLLAPNPHTHLQLKRTPHDLVHPYEYEKSPFMFRLFHFGRSPLRRLKEKELA